MRRHRHIATIIAAALLASFNSCDTAAPEPLQDGETIDYPQYIVATLGEEPETKTSYSFGSDARLYTSWSAGDALSVVPGAWNYTTAGVYRMTESGLATSTFTVEKALGGLSSDGQYGIFHPGDKIKSQVQFMNFRYDGQVQKAGNPLGHLGAYHTMRVLTSDYTSVNLAGCDQSSCMRFLLSGMEFDSPELISMTILKAGTPVEVLRENNYFSGSYSYATTESYTGEAMTSKLSLGLEGYGKTDAITAWMMMSNGDVTIAAGSVVRVTVKCKEKEYHSDITVGSATTLHGGRCHTLSVDSGWQEGAGDASTYEYDGEVVTLQEAYRGLDLVLMGDGFIAEDFENGTYDRVMREYADEFFNVSPMDQFEGLFNVYYVKAVSPERFNGATTYNGAYNGTAFTKFGSQFTPNSTNINGDLDMVQKFASKALGNDTNRMRDVTIVVVANLETHAGTCHQLWYSNNGCDYGKATSIAFCALGHNEEQRHQVLHHEACGHGFGKLADEYAGQNPSSFSTSNWRDMDLRHEAGLYRNVDKYIDNQISGLPASYEYTTTANVLWHDMFGTVNRYEDADVEGLGIYKGAYTYNWGFCRPTEIASSSIMNSNRGIFNAVCRRQIYYRACVLSGSTANNSYGTEAELSKFLQWDRATRAAGSSVARTTVQTPEYLDEAMPLGAPVLHSGHWEDCRFIED